LLLVTVAVALALPTRGIDPTPLRYLLGGGLVGLGIALNLWSDQQLKRARTTVKPHGEPTTLVAGGAFRLTRNPMYLGMALILAGAAVALGSLIALACPLLFAVLVERWFIRTEEANAEAAFGDAYLAYRGRVRRWL
jgi:protein-S-isoprenylcysteine O-methyltransferase Ste14